MSAIKQTQNFRDAATPTLRDGGRAPARRCGAPGRARAARPGAAHSELAAGGLPAGTSAAGLGAGSAAAPPPPARRRRPRPSARRVPGALGRRLRAPTGRGAAAEGGAAAGHALDASQSFCGHSPGSPERGGPAGPCEPGTAARGPCSRGPSPWPPQAPSHSHTLPRGLLQLVLRNEDERWEPGREGAGRRRLPRCALLSPPGREAEPPLFPKPERSEACKVWPRSRALSSLGENGALGLEACVLETDGHGCPRLPSARPEQRCKSERAGG